MNLTDLKDLMDMAATYPWNIVDNGNTYEVEFFDEEGDEKLIGTITVRKG
jgi:hypothetical protein